MLSSKHRYHLELNWTELNTARDTECFMVTVMCVEQLAVSANSSTLTLESNHDYIVNCLSTAAWRITQHFFFFFFFLPDSIWPAGLFLVVLWCRIIKLLILVTE